MAALLATILATTIASAAMADQRISTSRPAGTGSSLKTGTLQVHSMHLLTDSSGWVAGPRSLLFTQDRGTHWNDITPRDLALGSGQIESVFFLDPLHGWVIRSASQTGRHAGHVSFLVSRTDNGGITWKTHARMSIGDERGMAVSVHFINAQHGWVMLKMPSSANFSRGKLLVTHDGGVTWRTLPKPPASGAIRFISRNTGWMTGGAGRDTLYVTHDGGLNWKRQHVPGLVKQDAAGTQEDQLPRFKDGRNGSLSVISEVHGRAELEIYQTHDAGRTWQASRHLSLRGSAQGAVTFSSVDTDTIFAASADSPGLTKFVQGRQTHPQLQTRAVRLSADQSVTRLDFSNRTTGWILTVAGQCRRGKSQCSQQTRLYATADGGRSMTDVTPRTRISGQGASAGAQPQLVSGNTGKGFDKCAAASVAQMNNAWWPNTPWSWANIYIGGSNRGCGQSNLNGNWVNAVLGRGWKLVPTWVGPQAPGSSCGGCSKMSSNTATARQQGINEANAATNAASALGLSPPTIIYYDMERYDPTSNAAARAFIDGWVLGLHQRGNQAGVYGAGANATHDWAPIANAPDAVWIASWNGSTSVFGLSGLPDNLWANHQRIHQYRGGHNETWGGVTFNIDSNSTDAPVAAGGAGCTVGGAILVKYNQLGGANGILGHCITSEKATPDGVGRYNHFQNGSIYGSIYWTPATGAHMIRGAIRAHWKQLGWERSPLGYPTTDEKGTPDGMGAYNHFQNGSIYWSPSTGAHMIRGAIREHWKQLGWERSYLGYPTTDDKGTPDGIGAYSHFQHGSIYWSPSTGAHAVHGAIEAKWKSMGWERSCLGYPSSDEYAWNGLRRSDFQHGNITFSVAQGAVAHCQ